MVCAYLILVCGLSVQEALANFAAARPPGVKHEKFVVEVRPMGAGFTIILRNITADSFLQAMTDCWQSLHGCESMSAEA